MIFDENIEKTVDDKIDALTAERDGARKALDILSAVFGKASNEMADLTTERDVLKEALEVIVNRNYTGASFVARAALVKIGEGEHG